MGKRAMVFWSLCLVLATAQLTGAAPGQDNAPLDERVAAIVKSQILAKGVPSASVAVMRDGKMLLERAWGVADVDNNAGAFSSTIYPIGSNTKQFTAALVLKQVDRGRLTLTDTIGKHLAGLSAEVSTITIEQLLNHTSGLKRLLTEPASRFENISAEALLRQAVRDNLQAKPGTTFAYSNAGYAVLGVLVEKLYGKTYAAALHDEIARPLKLTTLTKCAEPKPGEAPGYLLAPGGKLMSASGARSMTSGPPLGLHHSQYLGQGGICATAADLVRWTHALHTGRVLSPASYQAMTTPRGAAVASKYGFGVYVGPAAWKQLVIDHGGQAQTGHTGELQWYPQQSLAVALLYNVYPRVPGVSDIVPRIVLGVPLAAPAAPSAVSPPAAPAPAQRTKLGG